MGVCITYMTVKNEPEVAPHLDGILIAMSIFNAPIPAFVSTLAQKLMQNGKAKTEVKEKWWLYEREFRILRAVYSS